MPFPLAAAAVLLLLSPGADGPEAPLTGSMLQHPIAVTCDGNALSGYVIRPVGAGRRPAVLCVPPFGTPAAALRDVCATLARLGFVAAAVDPRGSGASGGRPEFALGEVRDVVATLAYLRRQEFVDPARVGMWGASTGGTVALLAAAADPKLRAVAASLAPIDAGGFVSALRRQGSPLADAVVQAVGASPEADPAAYRKRSPAAVAGAIRAAVLLICYTGDLLAPPDDARRFREAMERAGRRCSIEVRAAPSNGGDGTPSGTMLRVARFLGKELGNEPRAGTLESCLLRCLDLLERLGSRQAAGRPVSREVAIACDIAMAAFQAGKYALADRLLAEALAALP